MTLFLSRYSRKSVEISTIVESARVKKVKAKRALLVPIIDTILLCGRRCSPFRGHQDSSSFHPEAGKWLIPLVWEISSR